MTKTLIKGGTVVTAIDQMDADVLIEDGKVVALLGREHTVDANETVDASGKLVIPGGIDVHTHMEMPFGGTFAADTFETGTRAAAWGRTTTIVDFAIQTVGESAMEGWEKWMEKARDKCAIDYGFHLITGDINDQTIKEMEMLVREGVTSFKMFMAYPGVFYSDDGQILRAMQKAAEDGATIAMHAENGIAIDVLVEQALDRGDTDPIHHGMVRRSVLEGEATHRAIKLAQVAGAQLYIVHLSAQEALDEVIRARHEGLNVWAETCPQYLFLSLE
ncbi:MAG TPA: amidohydrolase family protein, partial [Acidimicrobiia bacterium]